VKAYVAPAALVELGQTEAAREMLDAIETQFGNRTPCLARAVRAFIDGRHGDGVSALIEQATSSTVIDPEMLFYVARHLAHVGEPDRAMPFITAAVDGGYFCYPVMAEDPWLARARARTDFQGVLAAARLRWEHATAAFMSAGGPELLRSS